jgi:hypothetical protein
MIAHRKNINESILDRYLN